MIKPVILQNNLQCQKRNEVLDFAKGIGIVLMVAGHACIEGGAFVHWLHDFIYTFHMPFFLIVSGYLFKYESLNAPYGYIRRKFKNLYLKFVIYNVFFIFIHNWLWHIGLINSVHPFFTQNWTEYTWMDIGSRILSTLFSFGDPEWIGLAMWYLKDLFLVAVAFILLMRIDCIRRNSVSIPIGSLVLATFTPGVTIPYIEVCPTRIFCGLFLYSIGFILKDKDIKINVLIFLSFFAVLVASPFCFNYIELRFPYGIFEKTRFLLIGIIGFVWFMGTSNYLYSNSQACIKSVILSINKYAIPIITLHVFAFKVSSFALLGGGKFL